MTTHDSPSPPASRAGQHRAAPPAGPFRALGLPPDPDLTDDDVRAAWHRIAAATHPDRADGGDPAAFAAGAAAYTDLRTRFGRTEALADLAGHRRSLRLRWRALLPSLPAAGLSFAARRSFPAWTARLRAGRPARLALLVAAGATVSVLAVTADGWQPPSLALIAGALTWVLRGGRRYLGARAPAGPAPDAAAGHPGANDGPA